MSVLTRDAAVRSSTLLKEREVAARLHVSVACLRRWRLEGRGPRFVKLSALVRYRPEDLEQWLAGRPVGGEPRRTPR